MKLSFKNIAITLGIAAGAAAAAVITTISVNKPATLFSKKTEADKEELKDSTNSDKEALEDDILYV